MPTPICCCVEEKNCAHILAVKHFNGEAISNEYNKNVKINAIMAKKNSGNSKVSKSGSKRKYQSFNAKSNDLEVIACSSTTANGEMLLANEKIDKEEIIDYEACFKCLLIENAIVHELVDETKVNTNPFDLPDVFINSRFDLIKLKSKFDDDAWLAVINLVQDKKRISTCPHCKILCRAKCIECDKFNQWFHLDCENVSQYLENKLASQGEYRFKCSLCKAK